MLQLVAQLVGLLADIVIVWVIPLIGAALFSVIGAIIITINPVLGAVVIFITAILLVIYCLREQAVWQAITWGVLLMPYGALAIIRPNWAVLWGLFISLLALVALAIPGALLPQSRKLITSAILAVVSLHTILSFTVWSERTVFFFIIGFLAVAVGSRLFSQGARPWEIRRAQRITGRLSIILGLTLIVIGFIAPRPSIPSITVSVPRPIVSIWEGIVNHVESWAFASKRSLIGERTKTRSLEELEQNLQQAHREHWLRGIQRIPEAPFSPREWRELSIEQDP